MHIETLLMYSAIPVPIISGHTSLMSVHIHSLVPIQEPLMYPHITKALT